MKSIFTRPLFINPQAYLTIPELSYIQMATPFDFTEDSYSFVINTSGRIEGKLLKTSNDYILHLDLYSIDGNCVLGEFYLNNSELNTDNFNLTQSKNIITLQFGEQSSGNITYPGLIAAWDIEKEGKNNESPNREILKDLTGNGHDIILNNFSFSEMSGYGGYVYNFTKPSQWILIHLANIGDNRGRAEGTVTNSSINIKKVLNEGNFVERHGDGYSPFTIKVSGLNNGIVLSFLSTFNMNGRIDITSDGIYDLPGISQYEFHGFRLKNSTNTFPFDCDINIEQVPKYPGALTFDGIDDYGINKNMPLFNDYTIITKRILLENNKSNGCVFLSTRNPDDNAQYGAFIIEKYHNNKYYSASYNTWSSTVINDLPKEISWQTKNSYNGQKLYVGTMVPTNTFILSSGMEKSERTPSVFYCAYLFDRSLDEQEIKSFIRKYIDAEYVLPSEQKP